MGERGPETVGVGRPSEHYDADEGDKPSNMENHKTPFEIGILRGHGKPAREHGLGTRLLQSIDMKE
jgi:hypothetical protein